jgi:putative tricarboxylic transport membrane protein
VKLNDAVFGCVLLALGIAVLLVVQGYPRIPGQQVGPALFPGIIAAALCVCGGALTINGWRARHDSTWFRPGEWVKSPRHLLAFCAVIGSVVFYMVAVDKLGFLITATVLLTAVMWALQVSLWRSLWVAVVATLLIHAAFYKLLRVPLPWGLLTPYAW